MIGTAEPERWAFTIAEVAAITGIPRTSLYAERRRGALIVRKVGRRTVILAEDLRAFLNNLPAT